MDDGAPGRRRGQGKRLPPAKAEGGTARGQEVGGREALGRLHDEPRRGRPPWAQGRVALAVAAPRREREREAVGDGVERRGHGGGAAPGEDAREGADREEQQLRWEQAMEVDLKDWRWELI